MCKTVLREKARFLQKLPVFLGLLTLQRKVGESLFCINTLGEQSCLAHAADFLSKESAACGLISPGKQLLQQRIVDAGQKIRDNREQNILLHFNWISRKRASTFGILPLFVV